MKFGTERGHEIEIKIAYIYKNLFHIRPQILHNWTDFLTSLEKWARQAFSVIDWTFWFLDYTLRKNKFPLGKIGVI